MKKVICSEDCTIYQFSKNGYGDLELSSSNTVKCLFIFGQSRDTSNFVDIANTDAHAYLNIDDSFVQKIMTSDLKTNSYYFVIKRYGIDDWYKIEKIKIGRTILTDNQDNNVHVFLSKSEKMI
jgi:hypothetical protein